MIKRSENFVLLDFFRQIFSYREYFIQSVMRDLRKRYKRSVLGYLWAMLHPLGMMLILALVFSNIMKVSIDDYAIFLFAGLLPWNFLQSTALMSLGSIKANAALFGHIPVPKYLFIVSTAITNFVNYLLALIPLLLLMFLFGRPFHLAVLAFPIVALPFVMVVMALALVLAASNVFFDDTSHLAEVFLQALYFLCPVLYHRSLLPNHVLKYLKLNPLFIQIENIRDLFYVGSVPGLEIFALSLLVSLIILSLALWIFKRNEDKFLYFL